MEKDRHERDDRIDDATAAVIASRAKIAAARASADASNTAARATFEAAAVAANDRASASAVAEFQAAIDAAVRALVAEKLTVRQVVQLTELAPAEARSIVRHTGSPITEGQASAAPATRRESAKRVRRPGRSRD